MIKMLVTDIDGTVLNHKNEYSNKLKDTIDELLGRDIKVILATGRMFAGAAPVAKQIGLNTPIICYQGAMVRHYDEILWQAPVKNELAREIIGLLHEKKIHINLYNNDRLLVEEDKYMEDYCRGRFVTYETVKSFDDVELGNVSKLLAIVPEEDKIVALIEELSERYKGILTIVRSNKEYCEITDINATKGNALRFLADYYGFSKDEIMASGDQDNDYEMLKAAGVGVAMGNASSKLKEIADYVCPAIDEDGLVCAIERYLL